MRILFVDDDPHVLHGLRRSLESLAADWSMAFASGGEEALRNLETDVYDVVITDMRMPGMDGATLLGAIRHEHADLVRILVAPKTEMAAAMRSVPVAHQFLAKPFDAATVKATVMRATELNTRLTNPELRTMIGSIASLPSPPSTVMGLNAILARPDAQISDVVKIIRNDPAMSAKLLQLVNSAFFGLSHHMTDVREAVAYLGIEMVRNLTLAVEVFRSFGPDGIPVGTVEDLQSHAMGVAHLARELVFDPSQSHDAFVAGLLHDVGLLVLATRMPEQFVEVHRQCADGDKTLVEIEQEILGATHCDLGAYLLSLWGLPYRIIEAVARHHEAPALADTGMDSLHATYIAERLLAEQHRDSGDAGFWEVTKAEGELDPDYLAAIGMTERVAGWRALRDEVY